MMIGFADQRLNPLGYARNWILDFRFRISDLLRVKQRNSLAVCSHYKIKSGVNAFVYQCEGKYKIRNLKSKIELVRTAGLEPANVSLKN